MLSEQAEYPQTRTCGNDFVINDFEGFKFFVLKAKCP